MDTKHPFEKVVAGHGATVLRVCRVLLAGHDADDAWSETFLSAMRAYPDLPESANAGLPYAEVAQILGGITEATRRAASDGIRNLRKSYPGGVTS
jgi:DNA-directed RNA polymerase specialized sigma24 family protein